MATVSERIRDILEGVSPMFSETATVTETGPGGRPQADLDHGWGAVLADGTPVRVVLMAKVRTTGIPALDIGQVVRVNRCPWDPKRCSVDPADLVFLSPSKLDRRLATQTDPASSADSDASRTV